MTTPRVLADTISANGNKDHLAAEIGADDRISYDNLTLWIDKQSATAGEVDLLNRPPGQTTYYSLLSSKVDMTGTVFGKQITNADIGDLRLTTTNLANGPISYRIKLR